MSQAKIDIIKRQTDYDEEQIKEKLEKFNGDMEKVLKDFHGISDKKEETNISSNQKIFKVIREFF